MLVVGVLGGVAGQTSRHETNESNERVHRKWGESLEVGFFRNFFAAVLSFSCIKSNRSARLTMSPSAGRRMYGRLFSERSKVNSKNEATTGTRRTTGRWWPDCFSEAATNVNPRYHSNRVFFNFLLGLLNAREY